MAVKIKTPAGMIDIANDVIATVVAAPPLITMELSEWQVATR